LSEEEHEHDDAITSISMRTDKPLDGAKAVGRLQSLVSERGADILRTKGILSARGHDKRYVVQAVHVLTEDDFTTPWGQDERREGHLVFIGCNLDPDSLRQQFEACNA
jgi:G3E family GTPase